MMDVATLLNKTVLNNLSSAWVNAMANSCLYGGAALAIAWVMARTSKLSARWQCWLWRLALIKLLLGAVWLTPVELPWLPGQVSVASTTADRMVAMHHSTETATMESFASDSAMTARTAQATAALTLTPASWLLIVWFCGVVCFVSRLLIRQNRVRTMERTSTRVIDRRAYDLLRQSCREVRVACEPDVRVSAQIAGPCLVGILRPTIFLPADWKCWSDRELRVALGHEAAHLKRRDLAWNWLPALAETFFYFHPLVWIAKRNWVLAQEVATDEMALSCSRMSIAEYGNGLIEIVSRCGDAPPLLAASIGSSQRQLTKRLLALRSMRPARSSWTIGVTLVAAAVLGLFPWKLTGREAEDASPQPVQVQAAAVESQRADSDEREQAADHLKNKGGHVRFFHDRDHPDHWVQIILEGNAFGDDDMVAVSQLAARSPTDLHLRDTQVTARGLRMLLGDRIRSLALSGESTDDRSMQEIRFFTELTTLQIGQTSITDAGVNALSESRSIETLRLITDGLTVAALDHLSSIDSLKELALGSTFGDSAAEPLNRLRHLGSLELSANVSDALLSQLDRLPQLTELGLRGPNVTDATAGLLAEAAPSLTTLYLRHADLTDEGLRSIARLSNLEVLALDHTEAGDDGVAHLARLENLRWLDLSGADAVTDKSLETIGELPKMRQLFLMGTQVTTDGLEHLRGLKNLRHLDLQSTKVRSVPPWLEARPMLYISTD